MLNEDKRTSDKDVLTQFGYACKQLGVELEASSIPQAKGRVERLNQTLQSRLPIELRLAGITTIDAANEFLNSQIKEFNEKFSLPLNGIKSVFVEQPENKSSPSLESRGLCFNYLETFSKMLDRRTSKNLLIDYNHFLTDVTIKLKSRHRRYRRFPCRTGRGSSGLLFRRACGFRSPI